jgi:hypothetical protein
MLGGQHFEMARLPAGSTLPYYFVTALRWNLPSHHAFGALYSPCLIFRQKRATGEYRWGGNKHGLGRSSCHVEP